MTELEREVVAVADYNDSVFETEENGIQDNTYVEGDKVRMYNERSYLLFPNIVLEAEELLEHQILLINNVVAKASLLGSTDYRVYLKLASAPQAVEVGVLTKERLHILMGKSFKSFTKKVMLSETEVYEGDLIYSFIPPKL